MGSRVHCWLFLIEKSKTQNHIMYTTVRTRAHNLIQVLSIVVDIVELTTQGRDSKAKLII